MPSERLTRAYQRLRARENAEAALLNQRPPLIRVRLMEKDVWPAVTWSKDEPLLAFLLEEPQGIKEYNFKRLLRLVGTVTPETYGNSDCFQRGKHLGWHTDPHGDVFNDGTGLCWGVVCQLSGRAGRPQFVAGYQFGGCDGGPAIDFSRIFEGERGIENPKDNPGAREAARQADGLAQAAAEAEREYQEEQMEELA